MEGTGGGDHELMQKTYQKMCNTLFHWIRSLHQHDKYANDVIKFGTINSFSLFLILFSPENFHYFWKAMTSSPTIRGVKYLEQFISQAEKEYKEGMESYVKYLVDKRWAGLIVFSQKKSRSIASHTK